MLVNLVFDQIEYNYSRYGRGTERNSLVRELCEPFEDISAAVSTLYDKHLVTYNNQGLLIPTKEGLKALSEHTLRDLLN